MKRPTARQITTRGKPLQVLTSDEINEIDALLAAVSPYGEVHLTVEDGRMRVVHIVESHRAWEPIPVSKRQTSKP